MDFFKVCVFGKLYRRINMICSKLVWMYIYISTRKIIYTSRLLLPHIYGRTIIMSVSPPILAERYSEEEIVFLIIYNRNPEYYVLGSVTR